MQNQPDEYGLNLFIDSLTGAASEETEAQLAAWRGASAANERRYAEMKKIWDSLSLSARDEQFDTQRAYRLFQERVKAEIEQTERQRTTVHRIPLRRVVAVAAILIPFLFLSYFAGRYGTLRLATVEETLLSEISVPYGSKTQMKLQDGSVVWLNAGSRIEYDSYFGKTNRTCTLSGEAYLEVEKNADLPFVVKTGTVTVTVLGTRFNVQAYSDEDEVTVCLLEGSVDMNVKNAETFRLQSGQKAGYHKRTGKTDISPFVTAQVPDWMNSRFVFNGETFEQIAGILERSFNVKITIRNDRIKQYRFAGDFVKNETVEQIFAVMAANGKFRYRMNGNAIEVY
ncbi:MAG: FecR family protein [Tannerella sp.]|jgi:ferric-dicitrate binding protein FerR (iron transport regulator)|nr:FecR family protein [Tannerella sp.]